MFEFSLTTQPIVARERFASFEDEACGAFVFFDGRVRNHHHGKSVKSLNYTIHPQLTQQIGESLLNEAREKFPDIGGAHVIHRYGPIAVGESAILVAVSSPHRPAAFAATDFLAAACKDRLPMWKEEHFADGTVVWG